jgi:hypothetical protein
MANMRNTYKMFVEKLVGKKRPFFEEIGWRDMDCIHLTQQGQVAGCCERGNEPSGSIKV